MKPEPLETRTGKPVGILYCGDCMEVLKGIKENSIDAVVTDPPYGLQFMGREWDKLWRNNTEADVNYVKRTSGQLTSRARKLPDYQATDPQQMQAWHETWARECLRVLKPGGHLLSFGGTRTYHRMACAIEDAGFEIRDCIMWLYGCLDEKTHIATAEGVKPHHKAIVGDLVLCYDASLGEYSYQPILEIVEYDYNDTAFRIIGDFGEQVVTRNHRCIIEQGGTEVFQFAEEAARQCEARVPILEDLSALQEALSGTYERTSSPSQDMLSEVRQRFGRSGEHWVNTATFAQSEIERNVRGLRKELLAKYEMAEACADPSLFVSMQRGSARRGMEAACAQGPRELVSGVGGGATQENDWSNKSIVERWSDLPQAEREICGSIDKIRPLPEGIYFDGAARRLCDGAPFDRGYRCEATIDKGRIGTSQEPQSDRQSASKSDVVCNERRPQGIRAWSGHRSAVVRIVPFHHVGKVWCLRVPTGAFVAVRNGVAFPTGNSGFPKSHDVSKGIDRRRDWSLTERLSVEIARARQAVGLSLKRMGETMLAATAGQYGAWYHRGGHMFFETGRSLPSRPEWDNLRKVLPINDEFISVYEAAEREIIGTQNSTLLAVAPGQDNDRPATTLDITAPATDAARQWEGWGTALKPACEPIVLARKPLSEKTIAANVLRWGTGALNIDATRIPTVDVTGQRLYDEAWEQDQNLCASCAALAASKTKPLTQEAKESIATKHAARTSSARELKNHPDINKTDIGCSAGTKRGNTNINLNTSKYGKTNTDQFRKDLKSTTETRTKETTSLAICVSCGKEITEDYIDRNTKHAKSGLRLTQQEQGRVVGRWPSNVCHDGSDEVVREFPVLTSKSTASVDGCRKGTTFGGSDAGKDVPGTWYGDSGSAARFFYTAKAGADDRLGSKHPTVKPVDLMQWLVRLVCPKGATVLDPFAGTGTTAEAAYREGCKAILIEREEEYQGYIRKRMKMLLSEKMARKQEAAASKPVKRQGLFKFLDKP